MSDSYFNTRRRKDSEVMQDLIGDMEMLAQRCGQLEHGVLTMDPRRFDEAIGIMRRAAAHLRSTEAFIAMSEALGAAQESKR